MCRLYHQRNDWYKWPTELVRGKSAANMQLKWFGYVFRLEGGFGGGGGVSTHGNASQIQNAMNFMWLDNQMQ